jgi:hypothetical protein
MELITVKAAKKRERKKTKMAIISFFNFFLPLVLEVELRK